MEIFICFMVFWLWWAAKADEEFFAHFMEEKDI